jgi:hypothetical protein
MEENPFDIVKDEQLHQGDMDDREQVDEQVDEQIDEQVD